MARRPSGRTARPALRSRRSGFENLEPRLVLNADFGDAPAPYPTLLADDGARHEAIGPMLGATRDADVDGLPSAAADGDGKADDGVSFGPLRVGQAGASVIVTVSAAPSGARLDAWIDFNRDGSWGGPGEQIFAGAAVVEGANQLTLEVPAGASAGDAIARFRLSTAGNLGWKGGAADGEVEDYRVAISAIVGEGDFLGESRLPGASTLSAPRSLMPVDLDGDGDVDLVTGRSSTGWYENVGGTFAARSLSTSQYYYNRATAADLDGDGDMDVIGTTASSAHLERNDGNESFTRSTLVNLMAGDIPISTADVDGDGDLDLVGGGSLTTRYAWYENNGAEQFQLRQFPDAWDAPAGITAVDFDSDGDMDFLASGYRGVGWYENDGANAFALHMILEGWAGRAVPRDVDGDGDQDFVVSQGAAIHWHENDGEQAFTAHEVVAGLTNSYCYVDAADVDGDGDVDLLSTANNKVTWHENDGAEAFTTHVLSPAEGALFVATADLNGDGVLDIASGSTAGNKFAWRRQLAQQDFGDAPEPYLTTIAEGGASHLPSGPRLGATRDTELDGSHSDGAADDDGVVFGSVKIAGGLATVTVEVSDAPQGARLSAWLDFDRDGTWTGPNEAIILDREVDEGSNVFQFSVPVTALPGTSYARFRLSTAGGVGFVGVAADGEMEDHAVMIEPATLSTGQFNAVPTETHGGWTFPVDIDQDGDVDTISDRVWGENLGDGDFAAHSLLPAGERHNPYFIFHASDLDGDGDVDLMGSGDRVYWYENDGHQLFQVHAANVTYTTYTIDPPLAADFDGDGDVDLVALDRPAGSRWAPRLYVNDGAQNFSATTIGMGRADASSVIAVDFDGDGDLDVVTPLGGSSGSGLLAWYENVGGTFTMHEVVLGTSAQRFDTLAAGDVDGDGDVDLAALGQSGLQLFINDGSQTFAGRQLIPLPRGAGWPGLGLRLTDVDGDGDLDVLAAVQNSLSFGPSRIVIFENQGGLAFTSQTLTLEMTRVYSLFTADLGGDGAVDLLIGSDRMYRFDGQAVVEADFGDAPAPYPTLRGESGAAHGAGGPTLGSLHSADGHGAHSPLADGDASDDGVSFGPLHAGQARGIIIVDVNNAPAGARIDAWIDFDGDGTWNQAGEQILASAAVAEGATMLAFTAPASAVAGTTFARVRLSTAGGLTPKGAAVDGEVEDYAVEIAPPASTAPQYSGFNIAWGSTNILRMADVDGDHDFDLLTSVRFNYDMPWLQNLGDGAYLRQSVSGGRPPSSEAVDLQTADVDRDGDLDVAFINSSQTGWYENNGSETFRLRLTSPSTTISSEAKSLEVVDFDGDGDLDFLTARRGLSTLGAIVLHVNNGAGTFTPQVLATMNYLPATARAADLDGDGDLDLATALDVPIGGIQWFENEGLTFTAHVVADIRAPLLVPVDLDHDGDVDLATGLGLGTLPSTLYWLENDGDGVFATRTVGTADPFGVARPARDRVAAGDVDGDGDVDLVVADGPRVWLFRNDGAQVFAKEALGEDAARFFTGVAIADLNGDGDLEILASDSQLQSGGWFEAREWGDFNRDGYVNDADLKLWESTQGQTVETPGGGADGNRNGVVDEADRDVALAKMGDHPYLAVRAAEWESSPFDQPKMIDGFDFLQWQRRFGETPPLWGMSADWDQSGVVDGGDLEIWKRQSGQGVTYDPTWAYSQPPSAETSTATADAASEPAATAAWSAAREAEAAEAPLAARDSALAAIYAAGDFTQINATADAKSGRPKWRPRR